MRRGISVGLAVILVGLTLSITASIPTTRTYEAINISFILNPGGKYGPYDNGTYYHTMIFGKSVLKGEVAVEGAGIYITARGYNVQDFSDVYVQGQHSFTIAPAHDQYTFTFDNTEGTIKSLVKFTLREVWTASFSPFGKLLGFLLASFGSLVLTLTYFRFKRTE